MRGLRPPAAGLQLGIEPYLNAGEHSGVEGWLTAHLETLAQVKPTAAMPLDVAIPSILVGPAGACRRLLPPPARAAGGHKAFLLLLDAPAVNPAGAAFAYSHTARWRAGVRKLLPELARVWRAWSSFAGIALHGLGAN